MTGEEGSISNVTMPAVTWRQEFGEPNITVGVSRTLLNSFDIETGMTTTTVPIYMHYDADGFLSNRTLFFQLHILCP